MDGDGAPAATAFRNRGKAATARLSKFALSVRARVRAGNIVLRATVAYYGSSSVVSRAECEAIERPWRQHLDRASGRARGSP